MNAETLAEICRTEAKKSGKQMSNIIYVITSGCYSDYGICAVTTDKARAEELKLLFTDEYTEARVEEYEDGDAGLDETAVTIVHPYRVIGTKYTVDNQLDVAVLQYTKILEPGETFKEERNFRIDGNDPSSYLVLYILAPDEEHAKKIWYDTWAQLNAERLGL